MKRHPDFEHPFGIADWNGVRARVRRGPDEHWWMTLWRGDRCILFPGSADHLSWQSAMDQANRYMAAARRILIDGRYDDPRSPGPEPRK